MYVRQFGLSFLSKLKPDTLNNLNFVTLLDYKKFEIDFNLFNFLFGFSFNKNNVTLAFEEAHVIGIESRKSENILNEFRIGIEYSIKDIFFIRIGLNLRNTPSYYYFYSFPVFPTYTEYYLFPFSGTNLTLGLGIEENVMKADAIIGYSISDNSYIYKNSLTAGLLFSLIP